jgi:hypothetical protein
MSRLTFACNSGGPNIRARLSILGQDLSVRGRTASVVTQILKIKKEKDHMELAYGACVTSPSTPLSWPRRDIHRSKVCRHYQQEKVIDTQKQPLAPRIPRIRGIAMDITHRASFRHLTEQKKIPTRRAPVASMWESRFARFAAWPHNTSPELCDGRMA